MKLFKLAIIASGFFAGVLITQPSLAALKGVIVDLSGDVRINGEPAGINQEVMTGDRIQTGPDGVCEFTVGPDAVLRCYVNTDLALMLEQPVKRLALTSGSIGKFVRKTKWFKKIVRFLSTQRRFEIHTPTTVLGVRGTTFYVRVEDQDNSYICCCNGEISTMDINAQNRRNIRAAHHKAIRITKEDERFVITDAPMRYHHDPEMEALAARINETIDWSRPSP